MFINVSHPGQLRHRETQKAIRRRVMRDIGKSRRKRSRPATVPIVVPPPCISSRISVDAMGDQDVVRRVASISKQLQPYGYFAVEPNARARQLLHFSKGFLRTGFGVFD